MFRKFPTFYGTWMFIIVFTATSQLRQVNPIHNPQAPLILRSCIKLASHLHLCLPNGLFSSDLPTKILCAYLTCPMAVTRFRRKMKLWRNKHIQRLVRVKTNLKDGSTHQLHTDRFKVLRGARPWRGIPIVCRQMSPQPAHLYFAMLTSQWGRMTHNCILPGKCRVNTKEALNSYVKIKLKAKADRRSTSVVTST
jgi:hypothetical protein